ncbi:MAG: tRNA dihydrouridine synthase DusB [Candidatus Saganbacteria bacterium]|nr:tRNA dihydrouridine synthase DusB [Candidatus Saganbacteria bacterium]
MIKIGSRAIDTNIFLAPLAGCADLSYRLVCREHGAGLAFYEMADVNSIVRAQGKNKDLFMPHPDDRPVAAQLLGSEPELTLEAARCLLALVKPVFIDINAACPVKKVMKKRSGAYFMLEPDRLYRIVEKLAANLDLPVTVKMRVGFNHIDQNHLVSLAKNLEKAGAAALFVHGRTRRQLYHGKVDYPSIRAVKRAVSIPVFGSGDVLSPQLAKKMFEETGCDGILVARGSQGSPWIFDQIRDYLKTGVLPEQVTLERKKRVLLRHLEYMQELRQSRPSNKMGLMRKMALYYLYDFPNAAKIRGSITPLKSYKALVEKIEGIPLG